MSKCYELKRYDIETDHGDTYEGVVAPDGFYMIADEVDEAIAEIKAEIVKQEAENRGLKDENARLMARPCYVCKDEQVKALEKKFQELEGGTLILYNEDLRWRKYPDEKPDVKVDECVCLLAVVEVQDDDKQQRYVTEADYVLEDVEIPEGVFYRPYIGEKIEEDFEKVDGNRYISKVIMWRPMPKAPEDEK